MKISITTSDNDQYNFDIESGCDYDYALLVFQLCVRVIGCEIASMYVKGLSKNGNKD